MFDNFLFLGYIVRRSVDVLNITHSLYFFVLVGLLYYCLSAPLNDLDTLKFQTRIQLRRSKLALSGVSYVMLNMWLKYSSNGCIEPRLFPSISGPHVIQRDCQKSSSQMDLNPLSRFCTVQPCNRQTNRLTNTPRYGDVDLNSHHLMPAHKYQ